MKKEGTIGTAAFLAIAAVVGITLQTGTKPGITGEAERVAPAKQLPQASNNSESPELKPGCQSIEEQLTEFINVPGPIAPRECYELAPARTNKTSKQIAGKTSKLKFVIATLPDPLHTHQAVLFDQFTAAIQDAVQDEQYEFDSSWLPWEDEPESYTLLADQEKADERKELREQQPGILLFRNAVGSKNQDHGLVVFVVGEEATHGIHKDQFRNALAWVNALVTEKAERRVAILGPTFSGSLPSLTQVLSEQKTAENLGFHVPLDIYSGSVSSWKAATDFEITNSSKVMFHSFVRDDDAILDRFCDYMKWEQRSPSNIQKLAILSEDETAYGKSGALVPDPRRSHRREAPRKVTVLPKCPDSAVQLFYPRDISALRGAYQTKSLFDLGAGLSTPDPQRRSLPTDLADPAGKVHDSIRSYGSNQTPLVQEAFLLEVVATLRDLHVRYILLRGSNAIDQLFLANFLRRMYPSGRIVILSSNLLFIRERGATGLNGTMTLTNYPLFPLTRDWTEHRNLAAADRVFSSDTSEGTYIAFRVLLGSSSLNDTRDTNGCHLAPGDSQPIFVPPVVCNDDPIPDYSPPYWVTPDNCDKTQAKNGGCNYPGPATWLTVIGVNRFWPIASLTASPKELDRSPAVTKLRCDTEDAQKQPEILDASQMPADSKDPQDQPNEPGRKLDLSSSMKVFFLILIAFSAFHAWCCWHGSYTAKPNFLAHFAGPRDWRHTVLVFSGSCLLAFIAIVAGWGCGAFFLPAYGFSSPQFAIICVLIVCLIAWVSIIGTIATAWRLSTTRQNKSTDDFFLMNWPQICGASLIFFTILALFSLHVLVAEHLLDQSDRALTYWRAMHLTSGVSPIVPFIALLVGLYLCFWFTLHGLALFGSDRPRLPLLQYLKVRVETNKEQKGEKEEKKETDFLRMFSQEDAADKIEKTGKPLARNTALRTALFFVLLLVAIWSFADGVLLRGLGTQCNVMILMFWLLACVSLQLADVWQLRALWQQLRSLLIFLDRLPLRRTLAVMRGISWDNVWKMGGNVLEVRYKFVSRQLESMNHSISSLEDIKKQSQDKAEVQVVDACLEHLNDMRKAGTDFARWYCSAYTDANAGDLSKFETFQNSVAKASGTLLTHLLIPTWRKETHTLVLDRTRDKSAAEKEAATPSVPPQAKDEHVRNAEEFVCLTYLGFIQNILGRIRTLAMTVVALFFATIIALSTYPFDPRQALSAILIALFVILGIVIVKVYAEMHRDATLSYVTNTKPGELGSEFWFKVLAFGFAPVAGLLTRIFPGIGDFIFSWIQPGLSSLK